METDVSRKLVQRAYFVAGSEPWLRSKDDPRVESSVRNAELFLEKVPHEDVQISGGTTSDPDVIIHLYWLIRGRAGRKVQSFFVDFRTDSTCSVGWDNPDGTPVKIERVSIKQALEIDPISMTDTIRRRSLFSLPDLDPR